MRYQVCIDIGFCCFKMKQLDSAIPAFKEARVISRVVRDQKVSVLLLVSLLMSKHELLEWSGHDLHHAQVTRVVESHKPEYMRMRIRQLEGQACRYLGKCYYLTTSRTDLYAKDSEIEACKSAIEAFEKYLELVGEGDESTNTKDALLELGICYTMTKQGDLALEKHAKLLELYRKQGNKQSEMIALLNLGNAYCVLGKAEEALIIFEDAVAVAEKLDDSASIITMLLRVKQHYESDDFSPQIVKTGAEKLLDGRLLFACAIWETKSNEEKMIHDSNLDLDSKEIVIRFAARVKDQLPAFVESWREMMAERCAERGLTAEAMKWITMK